MALYFDSTGVHMKLAVQCNNNCNHYNPGAGWHNFKYLMKANINAPQLVSLFHAVMNFKMSDC